jgi:hypothetical protein
MYYFKKENQIHAPGRDSFDSVFYFFVVNMILCFSVAVGFSRLFAVPIRTRWLFLFCVIINLIFSILWYLPIRTLFSVVIFLLVGISTVLLLGKEITGLLSNIVGGQIGFRDFTRLLQAMTENRSDILLLVLTTVFSFVGSGILIRKNSAVVYHASALAAALLYLLLGVHKVLLWEALYLAGSLIKRIGYRHSKGNEVKLVTCYVKPLCWFSVLTVLFYTELPYVTEALKTTGISLRINSLLKPVFDRLADIGSLIFKANASPLPDLCFEYGAVPFMEVLKDYSVSNIYMFLKTNSLRLIMLVLVLVLSIILRVMMVRRQNAQLKAGSRRIRQTNRRRALQDIGEAAGRLATWYTGTKLTPWDEEFVVKTASALPYISGVDLERMTVTMNRMRYGKDEILEEDYRKALEIYLKMFQSGRMAPSEAVRRRLNLPV